VRKVANVALAALVLASLSSCGDGGGGSGGTGGGTPTPSPTPVPTPTPTPTATLNVSLSESSAAIDLDEGQVKKFGFTATYAGTTSDPIFAQATSDSPAVQVDSVTAHAGGGYDVKLSTGQFLPGGSRQATVQFRLCHDSGCATVYPGSTAQFTATVHMALEDWVTFQRNSAHTGAVAVAYDASKFAKAWDWSPAGASGLKPPATHGGTIFMTASLAPGSAGGSVTSAFAIKSSNASKIWETPLGDQWFFSGPAYSNGMVHVSAMHISSDDNPQFVLDETDGSIKHTILFSSQWNMFTQPTPYAKDVFITAGYYGNYVYSFNPSAGSVNWDVAGSGNDIWYQEAPAVDKNYVYYYSGAALDIFKRSDGTLFKSLPDPFFTWAGYDWATAPVLDGKGHVFLYSSPGSDLTDDHYIVAYSINANAYTWRSAAKYAGAMAYADGTIYALRRDTRTIEALDAATGAVKWTTELFEPGSIENNVIVTKSHVFFSTDQAVYAVDLLDAKHPIVWNAPTGGRLAITPDNLLLVTGYASVKLTAYKLD
jgi:hypothetical protein